MTDGISTRANSFGERQARGKRTRELKPSTTTTQRLANKAMAEAVTGPRKKSATSIQTESIASIPKETARQKNERLIREIRAKSHSWEDDKSCKGNEGDLRDVALKSIVIKMCNIVCPVKKQCLNEDYQSGAPAPGIIAGRDQDTRIEIYKIIAERTIQIQTEPNQLS